MQDINNIYDTQQSGMEHRTMIVLREGIEHWTTTPGAKETTAIAHLLILPTPLDDPIHNATPQQLYQRNYK